MRLLNPKGFTLIELTIVIALFSLVSTLLLFNVSKPKAFADITSSEDLIISTLKEVQSKSMLGGLEGLAQPTTFGVHFEQDKYVLFRGAVYNPADSFNLETPLKPNLSFSQISLPNQNIIFSRLSGEVQGFVSTQNSFTLLEKNTSETRIFTINRFGAINVN